MKNLNSSSQLSKIRVRIAPSPTGFTHIGTLRTALTNFLFAKKNNGQFVIRLEDTDQSRFVENATEDLIRSLKWAGIEWDEGIDLDSQDKIIEKGNYGPYIQSKRLPIFKKYIQELIDKGQAYYCFCSPQRLEKMRKEQQKKKEAPRYDKHCLHLPKSKIEERLRKKEPYVVRLNVPTEGITKFNDLIRGEISIENKLVDDQILLKSDGYPTYHLAVVVDDHLMKISHVLRGEEWLSSTPKHILIYQAFGWKIPEFGHLPQLLNMNGKKLSKRDGDVGIRDFIKKGYLPQALLNHIALLGWNPKTTQEVFSKQDLIDQFDIKKINKAGAKLDYGRLDWVGSKYLKSIDIDDLFKFTKEYLQEQKVVLDDKKLRKIIIIQKERISKLSELLEDIEYLVEEKISYPKDLLKWKDMNNQDIVANLEKAKEVIDNISKEEYTIQALENKLLDVAKEKRGELLWPLRVALTGQQKSPSPFECAWVLGKKKTLERIEEAMKMLENV